MEKSKTYANDLLENIQVVDQTNNSPNMVYVLCDDANSYAPRGKGDNYLWVSKYCIEFCPHNKLIIKENSLTGDITSKEGVQTCQELENDAVDAYPMRSGEDELIVLCFKNFPNRKETLSEESYGDGAFLDVVSSWTAALFHELLHIQIPNSKHSKFQGTFQF